MGDLLGLLPQRHRFKKHLNCVLPDYKMEEAIKAKAARPQFVS